MPAPAGPVPEANEFVPALSVPPEDRPRIGTGVEEGIAAVAMALVCVITFGNVLVRYFTNASFAFTEEFSVFLLVVLTLAGASAAFARNRHIRMEYFVGKLPPRAHRAVEVFVTACGLALFAVIAWYGVRLSRGRLAVRHDLAGHRRAAVDLHDLAAGVQRADCIAHRRAARAAAADRSLNGFAARCAPDLPPCSPKAA